jgi:hypothetical protein
MGDQAEIDRYYYSENNATVATPSSSSMLSSSLAIPVKSEGQPSHEVAVSSSRGAGGDNDQETATVYARRGLALIALYRGPSNRHLLRTSHFNHALRLLSLAKMRKHSQELFRIMSGGAAGAAISHTTPSTDTTGVVDVMDTRTTSSKWLMGGLFPYDCLKVSYPNPFALLLQVDGSGGSVLAHLRSRSLFGRRESPETVS